jgi:formylglycine-generating enzyme required for sulfatase activity
MGSSPAERRWAVKQGAKQEWVDWETPRKNVRIGYKFAVGKSEVTKGQYKTFVRDTDRGTGDGCYAFDNGKWNKEASKSWRDPGYSQQDNHPAVCVSWDDAKAYVRWLSRKTGQTYRLLSESEWEYTARAGTETVRYWGHDWENKEGCKYANVADFSDLFDCSDGYKFTSPAKKYRANRFGLHDMLGNVWEWTEDCWHNSYNGAPANGSAWTTGGNCRVRVLRGGSWDVKPRNLRSAYRVRNSTVDRFINLGFRVARTL